MTNKKIGVYIVEDHQLVRDGFIAILNEYSDEFSFLGEASNGITLLHELKSIDTLPNIVLMDINLPKMNGIEATSHLSKEFPSIKVVALTMMKQTSYIKRMLKAGAFGYLLKDCDKKEFITALRKVYSGESYFSQSVSQEVMLELTKFKKNATVEYNTLSKREMNVLELIVQDLSNQQIADKLHISSRTVDTHKQNILSKTQTNTVAGLVVYALKNNLIDLPD
jgi:DNA-binding NarL/FixJ family response regulator